MTTSAPSTSSSLPIGSKLLAWLRWQRVPAASMNVRAPVREGAVAIAFVLGVCINLNRLPNLRGILQTRLEKTLGRVAALLLTVVLFTAWHVASRYVLAHGVEGEAGNLRSVLLGTGAPVAVVALVLGVGWDRCRNLPVVGSMLRIPSN